MNRRKFIKAVGGGAVLATSGFVSARPNKTAPPNAVGILYDSTLCIGCKACVPACKRANGMPTDSQESLPIWDTPQGLSPKTLNVVKLYKQGTGETKDQVTNGHAFVKRSCLHCVDANCVSVCPVSAMRKDGETGIVTHHPQACIGCRYCIYSCPFNIPKFELDKAFGGELKKCELCNHRLADGKLPACVEACPTGAAIFGKREELIAEARRRLDAQRGSDFDYPLLEPASGHRHVKKLPAYQRAIYGEKELGGTQVLYLAGVPFDRLGLPALPERSYASIWEGLQHTLYKNMALPSLSFGALVFLVHRNSKRLHGQGEAMSTREGATRRDHHG